MRRGATLVLAAVATALAGCGSAAPPAQRISGHTLTIYFSGPLRGASSVGAMSALDGARLALAGVRGRIGNYRIVLRVLDDSTLPSDGWDPNQTTLAARTAIQDPTTVGYLGDFNSGASAISIPLLNRAGIPQVSPGSSAVGLTSSGAGAAPGEPQKYYPTGLRTFARVVPTDASQALALVKIERTVGCTSTFVLHDGEVDGEDAALTFVLTAQSGGVRVVGVQAFKRQAPSYASLVRGVVSSGADCVFISAIDERSSVLLSEQLARALPNATLFMGDGLATSAFTAAIPGSLDARLYVLSGTLPLSSYARRLGTSEAPAIYGYAAMQLMLGAIARATDGGRRLADRATVVAELFSRRRWSTILGSFRLDRNGDPAVQRFGVYRLVRGRLSFGPAGARCGSWPRRGSCRRRP